MTWQEFKDSLNAADPPPAISEALKGLWYDKKGNWEGAHEQVQDAMSGDPAWVHAFLHRKEGDIWNADYWYRKAGKKRPDISLEEEWEQITRVLLAK